MTVFTDVLIVIGALLLSAGVGWGVCVGVLTLADRNGTGRVRTAQDTLRGGTWIGILERLAVTGCLLAGQPGGVAVVIAVKGLGRYPELRAGNNPGVSERFVIGTLASLVWSGGLGVLGRALLTG